MSSTLKTGVIEEGVVAPFNYAEIKPQHTVVLQRTARRLEALAQETAVSLWEMGALLASAQRILASHGNGTFQSWMVQEAGVKLTPGYRLLNIHAAFQRESLEEAKIAVSALYALAEPSTPERAREEALQRARGGETITQAKARRIVGRYLPTPSPPPLPPRPDLPPRPSPPPPPDYQEFERESLMPHLHDAGIPDAPQMLSGKQGEPQPVSEARKAQARESLRGEIIGAVRGVDTEDEEALDGCADEILNIVGRNTGSLSIAARFGEALSGSPQTLADLTGLAIWACSECQDGMDNRTRLRWRKRTLRILDAITHCGGLTIYEHRLSNGQLVYSLNMDLDNSPTP